MTGARELARTLHLVATAAAAFVRVVLASAPPAMLAFGCAGPSAELYAKNGRARPAAGWKEDGQATFYAPRLAGHRTANGETYDPRKLTAAHAILPFGTKVAVQRTDVDLPAVVVRINDRCAGDKKIIDLSFEAAHRLHMTRAGIVPVHLRVISPGR